ncbi:ABC transporter substrate-binding protein [Erysipelothrix inopinata]|uniref:ABC transporter substrate-binding protein n=1 Tax=Erysipelothrix inopinata TaxID=225084 RepID=A0A7G9RZ29_9FIRM|nr:ABC transporter substrate-binding protein [Erysipelothrix inopinata]QNN60854.1 ABC transporter substrate-binding protein [Erysipelothrix inopinata]
MKKNILIVLLTMFILAGCQAKGNEKFKVGVIQWGDHPALNDSFDGMNSVLKERDDFEVVIKTANEDVSTAQQIASQFVNDKVDLIFAVATPSVQAAVNAAEGTGIPIVFSAVSDAKQAGLVENVNQPEGNVTGVSDMPPLKKQFELINEITPNVKTVGIPFNTGEINSTNQVKDIKAFASELGLEIVEKGISQSNELPMAVSQLAQNVDAMFIVNDNTVAASTGLVVDAGLKTNIPVFMAESGQFDQGIFASDSVSYMSLGKQAGEMIVDILVNKKEIKDLPVVTATSTELMVSQKIATELGIEIPGSVLERAMVKE